MLFVSRKGRISLGRRSAPLLINNLLIRCSNYKQGPIDYTVKIHTGPLKTGPEWPTVVSKDSFNYLDFSGIKYFCYFFKGQNNVSFTVRS